MTETKQQDETLLSHFTCTIGETTYEYSLHDDGSACIEHCTTTAETVDVPDMLDGHAVVAIAHSGLANMSSARQLTLPTSVRTIGPNAFSKCDHLQRLVLPPTIEHVDKNWMAGLGRIDEVVLPDAAQTIDAEFLKACQPRKLVIGSQTRSIDVPPMWSKNTDAIAIHPDNPYLSTDGSCLYSHDKATLITCVVESETYVVREGCRIIGKKAFAYNSQLVHIVLPESLEVIEDYAFLNAKLESFDAPPHLKRIGDDAFMRCTHMKTATLNTGLESLGDGAFMSCVSLSHLVIPASVTHVGKGLVAESGLVACAPNPSLAIEPQNTCYAIDSQGVMYHKTPDGLVLDEAFNPTLRSYNVRPGTIEVASEAFSGHAALSQVTLPEGVLSVGENAFKSCPKLTSVKLPSTLRSIGTRAFFNTALRSLSLPANLEFLGSCALAISQTGDTLRTPARQTLREIAVDPRNEHFFMHDGTLCERMNGYAKVVKYVGPQIDVVLPRDVTEIASYAFAGMSGIRLLRLHEGIARIGTMGLGLNTPPVFLEIELNEPIHGRSVVTMMPPLDRYGLRGMRNAFIENKVVAAEAVEQIDRVIPYSRNRKHRIRCMLERLDDPFMLTDIMQSCFWHTLKRTLLESAVTIADMGWDHGFDILAQQGLITRANIDAVVDEVSAKGHVASTAYLIALKRRCFDDADDYAL